MHPLRALNDLVCPPACLLCAALLPSAATVCGACQARLPVTCYPVCQQCGLPIRAAFDAALACRRCQDAPPAFEVARAPWQYRDTVRRAIHSFKYRRRWRVGRWLARHMASCAASSLPLRDVEAIVPVPMHRLKRWLAGYDPAQALSAELARLLDKPHAPVALQRTRWTRPQARLSWRKRHANVRDAFRADPAQIHGRTVLLVDDVLTSCATADACARALKQSGARRVYVLTAARTPLAHAA